MLTLCRPANRVAESLQINSGVRLIAYRMSKSDEKVQVPCAPHLPLPASDKGQYSQGGQCGTKGVETTGRFHFFGDVLSKGQRELSATIFTPLAGKPLDILLDGKSLLRPIRGKLVRIGGQVPV